MAYNKTAIFEQAKKAITENNLFFVEDVIAFIPCSKFYFYDTFKIDSYEYNELRDLLDKNKTITKLDIRSKLFKSQKSAELLALYRLICTPEEHRLLNQQYVEQSGSIDLSLNKQTEALDAFIENVKNTGVGEK